MGYTTVKVRKFELFYKINTYLQKTTICIGLQTEQIFPVYIDYANFFDLGCGFCSFFSMLFPKAPASFGEKKIETIFAALYFYLHELKYCVSDFKNLISNWILLWCLF